MYSRAKVYEKSGGRRRKYFYTISCYCVAKRHLIQLIKVSWLRHGLRVREMPISLIQRGKNPSRTTKWKCFHSCVLQAPPFKLLFSSGGYLWFIVAPPKSFCRTEKRVFGRDKEPYYTEGFCFYFVSSFIVLYTSPSELFVVFH